MLMSHLIDLLLAVVTVAGVRPFGRAVLTHCFRRPRSFEGEWYLSVGIGLFGLEMVVWLLGWLGGLDRVAAATLLVLCLGGCAGEMAARWKFHAAGLKTPDRPGSSRCGWMEATLAAVLGVLALVYLSGALLPPMFYDALEYHLGAPHLYIQQGRLTRIDGNVYSNFPFNTEMLYTYALLLRPEGVLAKVLHWSFALLTVGATVSVGRRAGHRLAGLAAAVLFLAAPQTAELSVSANIDLAVAYYLVCTLLALGLWLEQPARPALILTGAFAGIALGCKYIAGVMAVLPVGAVIAWHSFFRMGDYGNAAIGTKLGRAMSDFLVYAGVAGLFFSPWIVKNLVFHGNPVFPLLYEVFGGRAWSESEYALFRAAHNPTLPGKLSLVAGRLLHAHGFSDIREGLTLLWRALTGASMVITLLFIPLPRRHLRAVPVLHACSFVAFLGYLGWLLLTHQVGRFLVPLFPLIGLPLASVCFRCKRRVPFAALALFGLLALAVNSAVDVAASIQSLGGYDYLAGRVSRSGFLERGMPHFFIVDRINALPADQDPRILMAGEARPFGIRHPVKMSTVFNQSYLVEAYRETGSIEGIHARLRAEGFTHILHNEIEIDRLLEFYEGLGWSEGHDIERIIGGMSGAGFLRETAASRADRHGRRAILYEILRSQAAR